EHDDVDNDADRTDRTELNKLWQQP
ncbi:MAG: hypothetical protein QOE16_2760, partial [Microbacteriaceae bacterium]|nr:hypothetical protein [Microbacteriaceae bacterium]